MYFPHFGAVPSQLSSHSCKRGVNGPNLMGTRTDQQIPLYIWVRIQTITFTLDSPFFSVFGLSQPTCHTSPFAQSCLLSTISLDSHGPLANSTGDLWPCDFRSHWPIVWCIDPQPVKKKKKTPQVVPIFIARRHQGPITQQLA